MPPSYKPNRSADICRTTRYRAIKRAGSREPRFEEDTPRGPHSIREGYSFRRVSCLRHTTGSGSTSLAGPLTIRGRRFGIRDTPQGKPHVINQFFKVPVNGLLTTDHDIIPTGQCHFHHQLICHSTQTPPNAIANDGLAHLFGDGKSDSCESILTGVFCVRFDPGTRSALKDQSLCNPFPAGACDAKKFCALFQAFHRNGHNIRPTDACGPWRGVRSAHGGHRRSRCGNGSRGGVSVRVCWAGRCASLHLLRSNKGNPIKFEVRCIGLHTMAVNRDRVNSPRKPAMPPRLRPDGIQSAFSSPLDTFDIGKCQLGSIRKYNGSRRIGGEFHIVVFRFRNAAFIQNDGPVTRIDIATIGAM